MCLGLNAGVSSLATICIVEFRTFMLAKGETIMFNVGVSRADQTTNRSERPAPEEKFTAISLLLILLENLVRFFVHQYCPRNENDAPPITMRLAR